MTQSKNADIASQLDSVTIEIEVELDKPQVVKWHDLLSEIPEDELKSSMESEALSQLEKIYENKEDYVGALQELGRVENGHNDIEGEE